MRAVWEIAATAGAPIEGLAVINKLVQGALQDFEQMLADQAFEFARLADAISASVGRYVIGTSGWFAGTTTNGMP